MTVETRAEALAALTAPGAAFEVVREQVRGAELEVFRHRQRSLAEVLLASAAMGESDYLVQGDRRLGFAEHLSEVARLAVELTEVHGIVPGDRVGICARNSIEWIQTFWACVGVGAVAVAMNSLWTARELTDAVAQTSPALLVLDAERAALAQGLDVPVLEVSEIADRIAARVPRPLSPPVVSEDDAAVILFTSGTSGRAKAAVHSHRNVIAACWFHLLNDAMATRMGHAPGRRRVVLSTPLFHIAGLHNLVVVRLLTGDAVVLNTGRFDIANLLTLVERERVTSWTLVPTMASRLVEFGDLSGFDLSSLRSISVGTAPSSNALKEQLRRALPAAAASLGTTYGLTESSTAVTQIGAADLARRPQSVGRAVPTMGIEVRDPDGVVVPDGVEGEVCLRGPQMMIGYWGDPEATRAAHHSDGWFRTGDLGSLTDGWLTISSRRSDLILRAGENVYPAEVEAQIAAHPLVRECVVVGLAHADLGQQVAAVVVSRGALAAGELLAHLGGRLARYKIPERWVITEEALSRNATGKVSRPQVVAQHFVADEGAKTDSTARRAP